MAFMEPTCLLIFPIPSHQHIIAWISQLSYSVGRREVILDVKFYCSHTIFKRIHLDHLLTSLSPGFRPHLRSREEGMSLSTKIQVLPSLFSSSASTALMILFW